MSGLPSPIRTLLGLLLLAVALSLGWAAALGQGTRAQEVEGAETPVTRGAHGRKLYIFVFDALDVSELEDLPELSALAAEGLRVELEPCLDRFTTACVKEALTGRAVLDLFAPFENFGVGGARTGSNLLRDARAAGLRVAMVSTGDLRLFLKDTDEDVRVPEPPRGTEVALGLEAARQADLVVHHWVWHDVESHRMKRRPAAHTQSLADADAAIGQIRAGLPEGMDLLVVGDHGHGPDGRHLQGMDVPTLLIGRSANLVAGSYERTPIAVVRLLASAVLGIVGPSIPGERTWARMVAPGALGGWSGHAGPAVERPGPGLGFGVLSTLVGVVVTLAAGLAGALGFAWGAVQGAIYPRWMELMEQRGGGVDPYAWTWVVPALGGAFGFARRRDPEAAWPGAVMGAGILLLCLHPGLDNSGVLQNAAEIGATGVICAAVVAIWRRGALTPGRVGLLVLSALAAWAALEHLSVLDANFFRVRSYVGAGWARREPAQADLLAAALAGLGHLLLTGLTPWALLTALGAGLGRQLPPEAHIGSTLLLLGGLLLARGRWRAQLLPLALGLCSSYLYGRAQQLGVLGVVAATGLGLQVIARAPWSGVASSWSAALLALVGGYVGLAWTCGISANGIDYTFVVAWTTGRWHERLWWLMFIAAALQIFAPALVISEHLRQALGTRADEVAARVGRLALARFGVVLAFASGWLLWVGGGAVTLRLSAVLQDTLAWLALGVALLGAYGLGSVRGLGRRG